MSTPAFSPAIAADPLSEFLMKKAIHTTFTALCLSAALAAPVMAQDHSAHASHGGSTSSPKPADQIKVLTAGEVTRVDARTGKLTIRHEEIKNLWTHYAAIDTWLFTLADSAQPASFKVGDKVLFHAEDKNGALIITRIQPES